MTNQQQTYFRPRARGFSTDVPIAASQSRLGIVVAPVTTTLYQVNIGSGTVSARVSAGATAPSRGGTVRIRFDPEKHYSVIEP